MKMKYKRFLLFCAYGTIAISAFPILDYFPRIKIWKNKVVQIFGFEVQKLVVPYVI